MAYEASPNIITSAYRRLAPSAEPEERKPGQKPERREFHSFTVNSGTNLSTVFTNMLEVLNATEIIKKELSFCQFTALKLMIDEGLNYTEIAKYLGCHRETAKQYVDHALMLIVEQIRLTAEKQRDLEAKQIPPVPPDFEKKYQKLIDRVSSEAPVSVSVKKMSPTQDLKPVEVSTSIATVKPASPKRCPKCHGTLYRDEDGDLACICGYRFYR
jgi:predicted DNA-binding protein (UPF0251 family)